MITINQEFLIKHHLKMVKVTTKSTVIEGILTGSRNKAYSDDCQDLFLMVPEGNPHLTIPLNEIIDIIAV